MELIIAVALFVAIVGAWIFLPSSPAEKAAGHGAAPAATGSAGRAA